MTPSPEDVVINGCRSSVGCDIALKLARGRDPVYATMRSGARRFAVTLLRRVVPAVLLLAGCSSDDSSADADMQPDLHDFAARYSAAWSSQEPARVASFYAEDGSLTINGGTPSVGRSAIAEAAQSFMTAFPDMVVAMDSLRVKEAATEYHWTLTGTNTGPGGTGRAVRISGYEAWTMGNDGLIAGSQGHYDEAEYQRQLAEGVGEGSHP